MSNTKNKNDFHIHTNISPCGARDAGAAVYLERAHELGMKTIGFTNHIWDDELDKSWSRYEYLLPQTVENLLKIKDEIKDTYGMEVFIGCETEMKINRTFALQPEHAPLFDYILIPTSHLNMYNIAINPAIKDPRDVRNLMIDRFVSAAGCWIARDFHAALCHPFVPYGFWEIADELLGGITESEYEYCFSTAAGLGIPVEVNSRMFAHEGMSTDAYGFPYQFIRIMSIARECGCRIYPGSDSHDTNYFFNLHNGDAYDRFAEVCGIEYSRLI